MARGWRWLLVLGAALAMACVEEEPSDPQDAAVALEERDASGGFDGSAATRRFDAGSEPDRNRVMPGTICARFATIQCAGERFCCEEQARPHATCTATLESLCAGTLRLDAIAGDESANFDLEIARQAFVELERRTALCDPSVAAWALSPDGFAGSIEGTLASGEDCMPEGGLSASLDTLLAALFSCQAVSRVACLPDEERWVCAPPSSRGGRCFSDLNCGAGLYCENPDFGFDGRCLPRKVAGETCAAASECSSFLCSGGECATEDDVPAAYCPQ